MKKNITINLFGTLYAIDEDACALLEKYLENMKRYFGRREGGDEIADDIEHRVAEIFSELRASGVEAINIDHVRELIARIGNPEQMDAEADEMPEVEPSETGAADETATAASGPAPEAEAGGGKAFFSRKLFRDPDDRILGGVMSGICHYFGATDPLPWRIMLVVLAIFSFMTVALVYLAFWAIVPEAITAEDRLQMKGRPVNPTTLNEELMRAVDKANSYLHSPGVQSSARSFLGTLWSIVVFCIKVVLLFMVIGLILTAIFFVVTLCVGTFSGWQLLVSADLLTAPYSEVFENVVGAVPELWIAAVAGCIFLGIVLYGLVRSLVVTNPARRLSTSVRVTLVTVALLSLVCSVVFVVLPIWKINKYVEEKQRQEQSVDGHYLYLSCYDYVKDTGWRIERLDNVDNAHNFLFDTAKFLTDEGYDDCISFERDRDTRPMAVQLSLTEDYPAGNYHVELLVHSKGEGARVDVAAGDTLMSTIPLPSRRSHRRGSLSDANLAQLNAMSFFPRQLTIDDLDEHFREVQAKWDYVASPVFHHRGGPLTVRLITGDKAQKAGTAQGGVEELTLRDLHIVAARDSTISKPL